MGREIRVSRGGSLYVGRLPKGCRLCMRGAKLVLLVTGLCTKGCYYCPLSEERRGVDVIYANERRVTKEEQAIREARMIDAEGMGVTGGEPLLVLERTIRYIRLFKREFGDHFHVHLYTALEPLPRRALERMMLAGLDELRLHRFTAGPDLPELRRLTKGATKLGIEIPSIPGSFNQMRRLLLQLEAAHIDFVNINEMEFSPSNAPELHRHGFVLDPNSVAAVQGSEEEAIRLLEWATEHTTMNVHYCPIALKDGAQLRNRFLRRARHVARAFERISREGLLVKGIIIPPRGTSLTRAAKMLFSQFHIPKNQLWINMERGQLETSVALARRMARRLKEQGYRVGVVEEHPTDTRLQVTYTPL